MHEVSPAHTCASSPGAESAAEGTAVPRVAILADDLTSAGDGAAPFRAAGFPARIGLADPDDVARAGGVAAFDLDTRGRTAEVAGAVTGAAARAVAGADVIVKTVDSTLRGHLAVEIEAALTASGRTTAVIAPAFPAQRRTTVGGVQLLGGRPVHETAFAHDPVRPVRCADLTVLIPGAVRGGAGARLVLADASSDRDLDELVAAVPDPGKVLWVGSPGLAAALARRLGPGPGSPSPASPPARRRVLVVVGSLHPAGREQAARFAARDTGARVCVTDPAAVERTRRELSGRGCALLHGPEGRTARSVPDTLARAVVALAAHDAFDALVLTGGETARAVLLALGVREMELLGEPEAGIALGLLDSPRRLPVALKAGGFGDPDTLRRLAGLMGSPE
ncbi:four-carbon acid sugar kinase family protein [Streptomyces sp. NPDC000410]|uniref:four-carbon acid sugar kinase family protein n=1 Tax=Streptomyces sp. NPDC000410 TaxID=3154254 RepID=UPI0033292B4F